MPLDHAQSAERVRIASLARDLLDRVGDRWSALVIYGLHERPLRFSELRERIDELGPRRLRRTEISNKMLAEALRGLRRDGLVARSGGTGGHSEYSLTPLGRSFWIPMMAVHDWTADHIAEIEEARRAFDENTTP
jgi:DNA-binding HxlR family transcriptional regulator